VSRSTSTGTLARTARVACWSHSAASGPTERQVFRTFVAPRAEEGTGIRAACRELDRLQIEVPDCKHGGQSVATDGLCGLMKSLFGRPVCPASIADSWTSRPANTGGSTPKPGW